jgi:hypothetical protein
LISDIRDRDAQTELVPASRSPLGRRGTMYDHARQQHSDYHLDTDDIAMGDRHMLLVWLREVPRHILDGILAQPHDPADWPVYDCDTNGVEEVGS